MDEKIGLIYLDIENTLVKETELSKSEMLPSFEEAVIGLIENLEKLRISKGLDKLEISFFTSCKTLDLLNTVTSTFYRHLRMNPYIIFGMHYTANTRYISLLGMDNQLKLVEEKKFQQREKILSMRRYTKKRCEQITINYLLVADDNALPLDAFYLTEKMKQDFMVELLVPGGIKEYETENYHPIDEFGIKGLNDGIIDIIDFERYYQKYRDKRKRLA